MGQRRVRSPAIARCQVTVFTLNADMSGARRSEQNEMRPRSSRLFARADNVASVRFLREMSLTDHVQVKNFSQSHVERAPLVERDYKVHTEDRVGKAVVITSATPKNEQGGFYCEVCFLCAGALLSCC